MDNTYGNPKYRFPTQEKTIDTLASLIRKLESGKSIETIVRNQRTIMSCFEPSRSQKPKILVVMGTYTIGKEKIALGLAHNLDCLIYASDSKREILGLLDNMELSKRLTSDSNSAKIHIVKMDQLNKVYLTEIAQKHSGIDLILAIKPTVISDMLYLRDGHIIFINRGFLSNLCHIVVYLAELYYYLFHILNTHPLKKSKSFCRTLK
jgi:DNA cross-link repair 1A protein